MMGWLEDFPDLCLLPDFSSMDDQNDFIQVVKQRFYMISISSCVWSCRI